MTPKQAATVARVIEENHTLAGTIPNCIILVLSDDRTFVVRPDGRYQQATLGTMHPAKSPRQADEP